MPAMRVFAMLLAGAVLLSSVSAQAGRATCSPPSVALSDSVYVLRLMQDLVARRSLSPPGACKSVAGTGAYKGFALEDCTYTTTGRRRIVEKSKGKFEAASEAEAATWTGRVLLLNASADVLSTWTLDACRSAGKEVKNCALDICDYVLDQSAAQFPVKGIVIEPDKSLGGSNPTAGDVSVFFRDGVTVATAKSRAFAKVPKPSGVSQPGRGLTASELQEAMDEEYTALREIKTFARVGGISAACYQTITDKDARSEKKEPEDRVIEGGKPTIRWLEVARDTYLSALRSPDSGYQMFRILARVLERPKSDTAGFSLKCG